ncbi:MAG: hypothetical protein N2035_06535 [Chthoniobacterales bacterium]|nr:hypothetical protein [Chthoniobacterales bacterium]
MIFGVFIMAILTFIFVREFLAVRAFGILLLLAAEVLLCAAFLRPEFCRLFLVILAYGWIIAGMFFVGMPWILRDLIEFIVNNKFRFRSAAIAGISYGLILIFCAFLWIEAN